MEQLGLCSLLAGLSGFTEQHRGVREAPVPLEPDGRAAALWLLRRGQPAQGCQPGLWNRLRGWHLTLAPVLNVGRAATLRLPGAAQQHASLALDSSSSLCAEHLCLCMCICLCLTVGKAAA